MKIGGSKIYICQFTHTHLKADFLKTFGAKKKELDWIEKAIPGV